MGNSPQGTEPISSPTESDEFTFLDLAIILAKQKALVFGFPFLATFAALIFVLVLPKTYTATTRLLPPQQKESSAAAMLGALVGGSATASNPVGQALGLRNPNELYAGILRGHTIGDHLIDRFDLRNLYDVDTLVSARFSLASATTITAGKDGLIAISVDDKDPQRAADIANAYVEQLDKLMHGLAVTEAAQRRLFFEKQLRQAQDELVAAESALRDAIQTKGIAEVDAQSRALVNTAEQLRAQIAVKEIQLDAMRAFATQSNPDAVRLRQEIVSMKSELSRLEGGRAVSSGAEAPAGLENVRKLREVKFLEFTTELLTKQYEIAKIDEAKDAVLIQVVDRALPPDYKSKPRRALIVLLTAFVTGCLGLLCALIRDRIQRATSDPKSAAQIATLKKHLPW